MMTCTGQNREELDENLVAKNFQGDDANSYHDLGKGREIPPTLAGIETDQINVETIESTAKDD
jgi:hypothetical protein